MYGNPPPRPGQSGKLFYDPRWLLAYWWRWNMATLFLYLLVILALIGTMVAALFNLLPRAALPLWGMIFGVLAILAIAGSWWTHKVGALVKQPRPVVVMTTETLTVHDPLRGGKTRIRWQDIVSIHVKASSVTLRGTNGNASLHTGHPKQRPGRAKRDVIVTLAHLDWSADEIQRVWQRYHRDAKMNGKGYVHG